MRAGASADRKTRILAANKIVRFTGKQKYNMQQHLQH